MKRIAAKPAVTRRHCGNPIFARYLPAGGRFSFTQVSLAKALLWAANDSSLP